MSTILKECYLRFSSRIDLNLHFLARYQGHMIISDKETLEIRFLSQVKLMKKQAT